MATYGPLDYILALDDRPTCSCIASIKPGQTKEVLVRPELEPLATPIRANATRSQDGKYLCVEVRTPQGQQEFLPSLDFHVLIRQMYSER